MNRTANDFTLKIQEKKIKEWQFRECSICNVPIGFVFENDQVYFDGGCDCSSVFGLQPRTMEDVAELYNMQSHPNVIRQFNEFWGFVDLEVIGNE